MGRGRRSKIVRSTVFAGLLPVLLLCVSGCGLSMSVGKPPGPWHDAYRPITDPETTAFVLNGLARARAEFGEPVIPVKTVLLRRSRKTKNAQRYRIGEDFSLTQCVDPTNGLFVIYIGVDPGHENYYALLGHECAHLINPKITDWYMEGIATVFSEEYCAEVGKNWGDWKQHFMRSRREPYALSYRMMLDLKAAFPDEYSSLILNPVLNEADPEWLHINIDAWLAIVPPARLNEALGMIKPHVKVLRKKINEQYTFKVPDALK